MENKKVLFITYDMSGYYESVYKELQNRYAEVDYFNTLGISYKYKNFREKIYSFFYKLFTGKKLKSYYKYKNLIDSVKDKQYDITLIVRPDLFFDSHLQLLKGISKRFIAYYHDSINNIERKKDVIHFFDAVYSYEKKDVTDYNLKFITNFIYFDGNKSGSTPEFDVFSVMSNDYRIGVLKKLASFLNEKGRSYYFYVVTSSENREDEGITFTTRRMHNDEVTLNIQRAAVIADIHKFGIQDGLTFRVFEAIGYRKKLITTNKDIVNYDFYDPANIFVIHDNEDIAIPDAFFETPYKELPTEVYNKYTVSAWVDTILS